MAQQVQELIDRIKKEGIQTAQSQAEQIESDAKAKAEQIISDAKAQADQIVNEANMEAKKVKESTTMSLQQASRNMLLSLRKEIENSLKKILAQEVGEALSSEVVQNILEKVAENYSNTQGADSISVVCAQQDLDALKNSVVAKLQDKLKASVEVSASNDVQGGFVISFDEGKSNFDFTDQSLVEFLSVYLNEQVSNILKDSI